MASESKEDLQMRYQHIKIKIQKLKFDVISELEEDESIIDENEVGLS